MRIRKRFQNPLPPPDLSSPLPPSTAAAAVAPQVASAATGGKVGGAAMAAAAAAEGGYGGVGGRGLHPNERTINPTPCLLVDPPSSAAAGGGGEERGDLPPPKPAPPTTDLLFAYRHVRELPKREQDRESGTDIVDAHCSRWNTAAHGYDATNPAAPKRLGAEASEAPVGHGGHKLLSTDAAGALAAAGAMASWRDEEGDQSPPKKRRGGYRYHARGRSLRLQREEEEEDEEYVVAEGETKPRRSNTRTRRSAASTTTTSMVATDEGENVVLAAAAALVDANRGAGNGKKRRSPAVLMEGSRCSRVNGRGWRCCQQTLVGYSLCEHHLGKGRLRSVSSVRCNNGLARKKEDVADGAAPVAPPPSLRPQQDQLLSENGVHQEQEHEKPVTKRRNKIGMVKARSISSLLHQPDHPTPTAVAAPAPFPSPNPVSATAGLETAATPPYGSTADTAMAL